MAHLAKVHLEACRSKFWDSQMAHTTKSVEFSDSIFLTFWDPMCHLWSWKPRCHLIGGPYRSKGFSNTKKSQGVSKCCPSSQAFLGSAISALNVALHYYYSVSPFTWLRSWTSRPALAKASALLPHRAGALIFGMPHSVSRHRFSWESKGPTFPPNAMFPPENRRP